MGLNIYAKISKNAVQYMKLPLLLISNNGSTANHCYFPTVSLAHQSLWKYYHMIPILAPHTLSSLRGLASNKCRISMM